MTETRNTQSRRLRLCIIISSFAVEGPQGGAERFAVAIAHRLNLEIIDVTVCGLWHHGLPHEEEWQAPLHEKGITTVTTTDWTGNRWPDAIRSLRFLRRYFSKHPQDVINSHSAFSDIAAIWGKFHSGARWMVRTLHSEREWYRHRAVGLALNQLVFPWIFTEEIGVSRKIVSDLDHRPLARTLRRRAMVIYPGVQWEKFANRTIDPLAKRKSLGLPPDAQVIVNVGRFTPQKGHKYLIEAMAQIVARLPNCHLLLIGEGDLRGHTEELVASKGLQNHVHFLGGRNDVPEILQTVDLFASSSLWEGFPAVLIEAMAAHIPVVCTDVSGSRELIKNGHTGLIVQPGSGDALAEAIVDILNNRDRTRQMTANAYAYAEQFSIDAVAAQYNQLFMTYHRAINQCQDCG